ncbi:MAG TPA: hypothetical protein DCY91_31115 [Cyanobacteria bacterium UBA11370]|nr:hypothetical protein [Cyanobacteria bacterium UBA11370]
MGDLFSPSSAFEKIKNVFGEPIERIKNFAINAGTKVMEFVFEGVMGAGGTRVMEIIRRAGGVFNTIISDPVKFIGHLVGAVRGGFQQFSTNILTHLKTGLVGWLFGALAGAGLTLPAQFDLKGIVSMALQVLGLTYQRLRGMLVKAIGEQKVAKLEKAFDFLMMIVTQGLGAAWQKITEFVGNIQETVMGGIREWVQNSIITAAITKLLSMFNPAGAIIQAVTAIYNTVMFFIERADQIAALGEAVFSSIGSIAAGNIGAAVNYVEQTMGRTLPVVISFLARLIGLGGISEQIKNVIKKIQAPIDTAIGKVADFIVQKGQSLLGRGGGNNTADADPEHDRKVQEGLKAIDAADRQHRQEGKIKKQDAQEVALTTKKNHPIFKSITVIDGGKTWNYDYVIARSKITGGDKAEGNEDEDLSRAKTEFGKNSFSTEQLADLLKVNLRTAQRRTKKWTENPDVYGCYIIPGTRDQYTFDKDKAPSYSTQEGKHGSIYVDPVTWEILPGINIRDKFYKKKFRSKAQVLAQADSGQMRNGQKLYYCQNTGAKGPNHKPLVTEKEAEVAHTEPVVENWNKEGGGHDITQEERNNWYDDPSHLEIWCSSCNESQNQGVFIRKVGKNFRGPNDNPLD